MAEPSADGESLSELRISFDNTSARFTTFPDDNSTSCVLCIHEHRTNMCPFDEEANKNIAARLRDFWLKHLDTMSLDALVSTTHELYENSRIDDEVPMTARDIRNHFCFHLTDSLNTQTVFTIAQSFIARSVVALNSRALKDSRKGKRKACPDAIGTMEKSIKTFAFIQDKKAALNKPG